ncbi:TrkH family potassium uptake protein [Schnuerera sp. xch1]|uniref:TrkH family potassium uptake protein n=1 Tax=Schnuerera sp. xch1 TaxID=2874283 RepID=UPI001CBDCCD5|nr:TrkH family potassium uptake protein [Schnuerera sp. xch1]MBZ2175450.1 TrkH family potassium uptake protein [Schnuerera sp. xch1]
MVIINFKDRINNTTRNPAQVLVMGFAIIILIGTILLNLPQSSVDGKSIGLINALFTATSAVCVTGLVVVNTAVHWTVFGKIVILVLIQIGGLGLMTMTTMIALMLGKKITLRERLIMREELNQFSLVGLVKLIKYVIISTLIIEVIGATLLAIRFIPIYGTIKGVWFSIFHAISAFCNAGFDLIGESMIPFVDDIMVNLTIGLLIIIGGIGYTVLIDLINHRSIRRTSLHTKLVLLITSILLLLGFIFIFVSEYSNLDTIGGLPFADKITSAMFQSITTRTAGFNSIDMASLRSSTTFLFIILMFIGGSPGSTAGGIKTTTFGVIMLTIRSVLKGDKDVEVYNRSISSKLIYKALAVIGIGMLIIIFVTMILTVTEAGYDFLDLLFEVVSAFGTVGLTRNVTSNLSIVGKIIIASTMFVGRLGPITVAFALTKKERKNKGYYKHPEGKILIG